MWCVRGNEWWCVRVQQQQTTTTGGVHATGSTPESLPTVQDSRGPNPTECSGNTRLQPTSIRGTRELTAQARVTQWAREDTGSSGATRRGLLWRRISETRGWCKVGRGGASIGIGTLRITRGHHEELVPREGDDDLDGHRSRCRRNPYSYLPGRGGRVRGQRSTQRRFGTRVKL